jgi:hypothetical protein
MHPHPLWQVLKLVALPMAWPQRIGGIRTMIHGARSLLVGLLAAELERAVLDLCPRFTPGRHIPRVTWRLASCSLARCQKCEDNRRMPCDFFEELHEILHFHSLIETLSS